MKKIILVDGHNLLFRMFYGIPNSIKNSKGKEIKGLIGFLGTIKKLIEEFNPYSIIVIFDSESSRFNNEQIDCNYKENRIDYSAIEYNNPFSQLPMIQKALNYLEILNLEIEQNEADDYIASIVNKFKCYEFIIHSTDTDFIQLVNNRIKLHMSRGKNSILYDKNAIFKKYQVFPKQYIEYKSLVGDACDNIKGVKGIGKITAGQILKNKNIKIYINSIKESRIKTLLLNNAEQIKRNKKLIALDKNLDISEINIKPIDNYKCNLKVREVIINADEN